MKSWNSVDSVESFIKDVNRDRTVLIRAKAGEDESYVALHSRDPRTGVMTAYHEDMAGANRETVQNRITQIQAELSTHALRSEQKPWI